MKLFFIALLAVWLSAGFWPAAFLLLAAACLFICLCPVVAVLSAVLSVPLKFFR